MFDLIKKIFFNFKKPIKKVTDLDVFNENIRKCMHLNRLCEDKIITLVAELQSKSLSLEINGENQQIQLEIDEIKKNLIELSKEKEEINETINAINQKKFKINTNNNNINSINVRSELNKINSEIDDLSKEKELESRIAQRKFDFFQDQ